MGNISKKIPELNLETHSIGWTLRKLGDVTKIVGGGTPSSKNHSYYEGNIPWATVRDMNTDLINQTERNISIEALENSSSNLIQSGNIVIATRVGLGKVCFLAQDTAINQDLKAVIPILDSLDKGFLYKWLLWKSAFIISNGTGATVKGVKLDFIKKLVIPLPPLPEQRAIVAKLDALFERIDKAIALVKENIAHTEALMGSVLDEEFGKYTNNEMLNFLEAVDIPKGNMIPQDNVTYNYIGLENIESITGKLINFTPENGSEIKSAKTHFNKNDVLYGKLRPYLNKVLLAPFDGIVTTEIIPLRCKKQILPDYLTYYLRSETFLSVVNANTSGARMPRATAGFFKTIAKVPVPSIKHQQLVIEQIKQSSKRISFLQEKQSSNLSYLESLKQSLLDVAFKGELV